MRKQRACPGREFIARRDFSSFSDQPSPIARFGTSLCTIVIDKERMRAKTYD